MINFAKIREKQLFDGANITISKKLFQDNISY